jgi:hypothetical protein
MHFKEIASSPLSEHYRSMATLFKEMTGEATSKIGSTHYIAFKWPQSDNVDNR